MRFTYLLAGALLMLMACNANNAKNESITDKQNEPDTAAVEQAAPEVADSIQMTELSAEIYNRVLNYSDATPAFLEKHCTAEFLKQLSDAYDMDGEGYAIWLLRSGAQDGDGESKVTLTKFIAPNAIEVEFSDMGFQCVRILTFENRSGQWLLGEVTQPNGHSIF